MKKVQNEENDFGKRYTTISGFRKKYTIISGFQKVDGGGGGSQLQYMISSRAATDPVRRGQRRLHKSTIYFGKKKHLRLKRFLRRLKALFTGFQTATKSHQTKFSTKYISLKKRKQFDH